MLQSHVITIDGILVGAAVRLDAGYRFVAIHLKLEDLDTRILPTLEDVNRLARRIWRGGPACPPELAPELVPEPVPVPLSAFGP